MTSIRRQLTRELVTTLAILAGVGLIAIYLLVWYDLRRSLDDGLRARAVSISALTELEEGEINFDFSPDFLADYHVEKPRNFFEIWDESGGVVKKSPSLRNTAFASPDKTAEKKPVYANLILPNGRHGRSITLGFTVLEPARPGVDRRQTERALKLVVAIDNHELNETLKQLLFAVIACGTLLLIGVFYVVPRVLRRGLRPLEDLALQTERIDAGSLGTRFATETLPVELQPVSRRLNDLLERLESSFARERRFSADLAHELRTPLAELRSMAECALKWPETRHAANDHDALAIAQQMETLVERMLALTRGDRGDLATKIEPVDLEVSLRSTWSRFATRASERNLKITLSLQPATALADQTFLRSILNNLCDNAVDYTEAGGQILISLETVEQRACVRVANTTHELTAADLTKIFDRFWRKESARTPGQHYGLGLSLSHMFATAMGWELTADFDAEGRLVFSLSGPKV